MRIRTIATLIALYNAKIRIMWKLLALKTYKSTMVLLSLPKSNILESPIAVQCNCSMCKYLQCFPVSQEDNY